MSETLAFLTKYEVWIYFISAGIGLIYIRKVILAIEERRSAVFGLERENANRQLTSAASILGIMILLAAGEFALVTFVAPFLPQTKALATPTIDLLATPTITLPVAMSTPVAGVTPTPMPAKSNGCIPGQLEFTNVEPGQEFSKTIKLMGTTNVPGFGFYKYEYGQSGQNNWVTIAAGNEIKINAEIGTWNISSLPQGDYELRLVVINQQNESLPPCVVPIRVVSG
ncbi:MAG: hypothetical protein GYA12_10875 [Chloroflexi bacterium]|jgi:hypothetical protein|nr:hypothetical protein [Chloroflexota bacterium]BCY19424.1 hypothetical protein hrd7_32730 [Leptolinea sp. HRD-7]